MHDVVPKGPQILCLREHAGHTHDRHILVHMIAAPPGCLDGHCGQAYRSLRDFFMQDSHGSHAVAQGSHIAYHEHAAGEALFRRDRFIGWTAIRQGGTAPYTLGSQAQASHIELFESQSYFLGTLALLEQGALGFHEFLCEGGCHGPRGMAWPRLQKNRAVT